MNHDEKYLNSNTFEIHTYVVNICKDHRDKIEVPDPLAVEDLISCKLSNKRKLARLITQYRDMFFPIFRRARPLPSSGCYRE